MISILPDDVVCKIAAGEVVERPASVIKELVENSIDANANIITVEIKSGGVDFIRVSDNGKGIKHEEVSLAFCNHATSKINSFDDFQNINTLGFRGEALCSIAAVSKLNMTTKQTCDEFATNIQIHGGKTLSIKKVGSGNGTTIIIRDLFYNTPARLKFLKKPAVEAGYVLNLIHKFVLSNPHIAFKFINNERQIISTNGDGKLKSSMLYVIGNDAVHNMLPVELFDNDNLKLTGYVSKPELSRNNRTHQYFFVNGRYIKNQSLQYAVESVYKSRMIIGRFPLFVLNLSINPNRIDVNVHPAKSEIRFDDENMIFNFVRTVVYEAIHKVMGTMLSSFHNAHHDFKMDFENDKQLLKSQMDLSNHNVELKSQMDLSFSKPPTESNPRLSFRETAYAPIKLFSETQAEFKIIGQVFNTYWLVEKDNDLLLIDQHAAHERILFDKFMRMFNRDGIDSQLILEPITLDLDDHETSLIKDNMLYINKLGFRFEQIADCFLLKGIPNGTTVDLIHDLINSLKDYETNIAVNKIISQACKKAVKANDKLSIHEANELIKNIMQTDNPFNCPHGRPTVIKLSRVDLEKMFKRIT